MKKVPGRMHNPPHPGLLLREEVLPALGVSVTAAAAALGVARTTLSRVLNGTASVSPAMALRLERWLGLQTAHDLWVVGQKSKAQIDKIKPRGAP